MKSFCIVFFFLSVKKYICTLHVEGQSRLNQIKRRIKHIDNLILRKNVG